MKNYSLEKKLLKSLQVIIVFVFFLSAKDSRCQLINSTKINSLIIHEKLEDLIFNEITDLFKKMNINYEYYDVKLY